MKNLQELVREAQKKAQQIQQKMSEIVVEGSSGGGMVVARLNGAKQLLSIKIDPEAVNPSDVEMLEDLIVAAVNDANRKAEEVLARELGGLAQALKIPGLF